MKAPRPIPTGHDGCFGGHPAPLLGQHRPVTNGSSAPNCASLSRGLTSDAQHQWSIVAVAATVRVDGGTIAEARIGLTNMGSTPLRATSVEQALVGKAATEDAVREAAASAAEGTNPPSDLNGDSAYRKHLATVLTRRAVLAAAGA